MFLEKSRLFPKFRVTISHNLICVYHGKGTPLRNTRVHLNYFTEQMPMFFMNTNKARGSLVVQRNMPRKHFPVSIQCLPWEPPGASHTVYIQLWRVQWTLIPSVSSRKFDDRAEVDLCLVRQPWSDLMEPNLDLHLFISFDWREWHPTWDARHKNVTTPQNLPKLFFITVTQF